MVGSSSKASAVLGFRPMITIGGASDHQRVSRYRYVRSGLNQASGGLPPSGAGPYSTMADVPAGPPAVPPIRPADAESRVTAALPVAARRTSGGETEDLVSSVMAGLHRGAARRPHRARGSATSARCRAR